MNIIIRPHGSGFCYCRPDTTWERENKDYYVPDCVSSMFWAPILFVRISKAGKCIGEKFASRYYDAFNFGALMYCHMEDTDERAFTSCADHTSLLPAPLFNPVVMENEELEYEVFRNGEAVFRGKAVKSLIEETICKASRLTSLRIGDFIAVELAAPEQIAGREEETAGFKGTFCEKDIFDIRIIF